MIHRADWPSRNSSLQCSTEKEQKPFEPPMNTDERRLKADKAKAFLVIGLPQSEKTTTNGTKAPCERWEFTNSIILPWAIPLRAAAVGPDDPHRSAGAGLRALGLSLLRVLSGGTEGPARSGARPTIKEAFFRKIHFIFIRQLSVFIGVHRWLKIFYFKLLNQNLSVDAFVGACDDSVST